MEHSEREELIMKELVITVLPQAVWPGEQAWAAARRPKTAKMVAVNCILARWFGLGWNACDCCVIEVVDVDVEESEKRAGEGGFIYLDPVPPE